MNKLFTRLALCSLLISSLSLVGCGEVLNELENLPEVEASDDANAEGEASEGEEGEASEPSEEGEASEPSEGEEGEASEPSEEGEEGEEGEPTEPSEDNGKLTVVGADTFNQYQVDYAVGMKWVYEIKTEVDTSGVELPGLGGLPDGFEFPTGFRTAQADVNITITQTVTKVDGDMVTIETVTESVTTTTSERTFNKNEGMEAMFVQTQNEGFEGTLTFADAGDSESVNVPAGDYNAEPVSVKMEGQQVQDGASAEIDQEGTVWIVDGVGMVKYVLMSEQSNSTSGVTVDVKTTTTMELVSFSN